MTDSVFDIEKTISRRPSVLFKWIKSMNENSGKFGNLMDDHDKIVEAKALCVLLCSQVINIDEFLVSVFFLDIFDLDELGPFFANWTPSFTRPPIVDQEMQKLRNDPNWLKESYW